MIGLIYNENEELLDVIDFENIRALNAYKTANPSHTINLEEDLENPYIILDDIEESDFEESLW